MVSVYIHHVKDVVVRDVYNLSEGSFSVSLKIDTRDGTHEVTFFSQNRAVLEMIRNGTYRITE